MMNKYLGIPEKEEEMKEEKMEEQANDEEMKPKEEQQEEETTEEIYKKFKFDNQNKYFTDYQ